MNNTKPIKRAKELLWVMGMILVALGVSICSKADLGVSMIAAPAFVLSEALLPLWSGFTVGVSEYLFQGILLVLLCLITLRFNWRYLLAFAVAVLYGYILNLFLWFLSFVEFGAVWQRWVGLLIGDCITALGVACFFRTSLPLQVYELFVAKVAQRFHLSLAKVKSCFDFSLLFVSIALAIVLFGDIGSFDFSSVYYSSFHSIGLGTLLTTAINSPLIHAMGKLLDRFFDPSPIFPRLVQNLEQK